MLIIRETIGGGHYMGSLYCVLKFSTNLKLLKNKIYFFETRKS